MKKLTSVLVVAMIFALAFTVAASASGEIYTPGTGNLYSIDFDLSTVENAAVKDGTMYGMVVIEAEEGADFALTQDNIRYIDQANANDNTLTFSNFAPMDLTGDDTKYIVYIGGGNLDAATRIGELLGDATLKGVALDKAEETLYVDQTLTLTATLSPSYAVLEGDIVWTSSNSDVAEVVASSDGLSATVTAKAVNAEPVVIKVTVDGKEATCAVTVAARPAVSAVTLDKIAATLNIEDTLTLVPTVTPEDALYTLEWASDNNAVATVEDGVVTAVAAGEAKITVTVAGTQIKAECVVTVEEVTALCGDVTGDGAVNQTDSTFLARHFANWGVFGNFNYDEINEANSDINADGTVNQTDSTMLARHFANWGTFGGWNYGTLPVTREASAQ